MEQRRALCISHRRLVTEKRRGRLAKYNSIDSRVSASPADPRSQILEATLSSSSSDRSPPRASAHTDATTCINHTFDEEIARRPVQAHTHIPIRDLTEKCGLGEPVMITCGLVGSIRARPRSEMRSFRDSYQRRTPSVCRPTQLRLELETRTTDRPGSAWSRAKPTYRTSVSYLDELVKRRQTRRTSKTSMNISPQLRRKKRQDRINEAETRQRALNLHTRLSEWKQARGVDSKPPSSVFDISHLFSSHTRATKFR